MQGVSDVDQVHTSERGGRCNGQLSEVVVAIGAAVVVVSAVVTAVVRFGDTAIADVDDDDDDRWITWKLAGARLKLQGEEGEHQ